MEHGTIRIDTEYQHGDRTVFPMADPYAVRWENHRYSDENVTRCQHCDLPVAELADGWNDTLVYSVYCDDEEQDQRHEPHTVAQPLDWWHSCLIEADPEWDRVTVAIRVSEAAEQFVMQLERTAQGRYLVEIPHPDEASGMHAWPGTLQDAASPGAYVAQF